MKYITNAYQDGNIFFEGTYDTEIQLHNDIKSFSVSKSFDSSSLFRTTSTPVVLFLSTVLFISPTTCFDSSQCFQRSFKHLIEESFGINRKALETSFGNNGPRNPNRSRVIRIRLYKIQHLMCPELNAFIQYNFYIQKFLKI